jgi:toxin FitB
MIILDTNVLSGLMQQQPDQQVVAWLDEQPAQSIWLNSITVFEIRFGLALLASGQRKKLLHERFEELLQDDLQNRVLFFDAHASAQAAQLAADRKAGGRPIDMRDTFIEELLWLTTQNWPLAIFDTLATCQSPSSTPGTGKPEKNRVDLGAEPPQTGTRDASATDRHRPRTRSCLLGVGGVTRVG